MGCDIHIMVEKKIDKKWVMIASLNNHQHAEDRNYRRFAALCGVRGIGPEHKGIPQDVSEGSKYHIDYWGPDGHNHSFLPLKEAAELFLKTEENPSAYAKSYPIENYFDIEDKSVDEHRIVFFFDN